jgi:thiol:disulfide interchange protein DsbA
VNRREFSARALGAAAACSPLLGVALSPEARAQGAVPVEGKQYARIDPAVPTTAPGKIEVLEFFSYACPHCNAFEPTVAAWSKRLPPDVVFSRVPVPFLMNADNFMRTYYTLETMGQLPLMQPKVFASVHIEHQYLEKPADIVALMTKNGVDGAKFMDVFNSFSVATSLSRARKTVAAYKIESVPTMTIQGRYTTSPAQAGGQSETVSVVDYLIDRARKG